ncbi:MAG: DNA/RNA non-specific endonuclease [Kineosporiaceae bacterium]
MSLPARSLPTSLPALVTRLRGVLPPALLTAVLAAALALAGAAPARADDSAARAESEADYARYGGAVAYGTVLSDGRRTASEVVVTAAVVAAASDREIGSEADPDIIPPGFYDLGTNRSRGHVIGRQLGGSGDVEANLVALYQNRANSPVMSGCEGAIADHLRDGLAAGDDLYYRVEPVYGSTAQDHPTAVWLYATDNGAVLVDMLISNTPEATVTYGSGNRIC